MGKKILLIVLVIMVLVGTGSGFYTKGLKDGGVIINVDSFVLVPDYRWHELVLYGDNNTFRVSLDGNGMFAKHGSDMLRVDVPDGPLYISLRFKLDQPVGE